MKKVWFEALLLSAVARPERKVERDFSLCQFRTSLRQSDEQGVTWKFSFKEKVAITNIFEDFFPQWLHLQKQSVPCWWRRVWQQLKQATFLLEKSNYPTLLTATLKWHFLRKHLKYISKATIKWHENKRGRFFVPYLFSELFFACRPQLWHKYCYFSPPHNILALELNWSVGTDKNICVI